MDVAGLVTALREMGVDARWEHWLAPLIAELRASG
jgi:hypothetical protein